MFLIHYLAYRLKEFKRSLYRRKILNHYARVWGCTGDDVAIFKGPTHELPTGFSVREFPPVMSRSFWVYSTCCMSQPDDCRGLELHIFSPCRSMDSVELLCATAHFHRYGAELGWGHTVNFGKPWMEGSVCDHGLISTPYIDGPGIETLKLSRRKSITCLWLIPVTTREVNFKIAHGIEALEQCFEAANLNYLDPKRRSVC